MTSTASSIALRETHVVVVGGGFAGLNCVKALAKNKNLRITLIDEKNHHLFQPLLYQVATAGLNPSDIAAPIRSQFIGRSNVAVQLGRVSAISLEARSVQVGELHLAYDYLVLACGVRHSYFGHPEWEPFAPGLKSLEQATEIRRRILTAFEEAENETDETKQKVWLSFVVVGGGPTGVELAGAIADISRTVLVNDFRRIRPSEAQVTLLEAGPRILSAFDEKLSQRAQADLEKLGVNVRLNARVTDINAERVAVGTELIPTKTVLWAAGVEANGLSKTLGVPLDSSGRVPVTADLSLEKFPEVFVVGDMASAVSEGLPVPTLAPSAIQMGSLAAANIVARLQGQSTSVFRYHDKGIMATIGKRRAIAQTGTLRLTGSLAWLAWLFVHIAFLIEFRSKVRVFLDWAWSYAFSKRGARLITSAKWRLDDK
jgi:NADH:ubiquinone reductase (H+-translocating)